MVTLNGGRNKVHWEGVLLEKLTPGVVQYSFKTIIQPPFQGSFLFSPLSGPLRRWGNGGEGGGGVDVPSV